ncbi:RNA-binding protein 42-like [Pyrus x bretschneideri]|uniref:RNA-binding protein 42-like n=1 Tax=Pyrus x bretschneideri TaxID=225117 RepID=UPI00202DF525|nr:RNA-binding protein 42-like [Pyrus x bretschneideri]
MAFFSLSLSSEHQSPLIFPHHKNCTGLSEIRGLDPSDLAGALKEMNGKYVGNQPIKLRKSNWRERIDYDALERQKSHTHKKPKPSKKSILHK